MREISTFTATPAKDRNLAKKHLSQNLEGSTSRCSVNIVATSVIYFTRRRTAFQRCCIFIDIIPNAGFYLQTHMVYKKYNFVLVFRLPQRCNRGPPHPPLLWDKSLRRLVPSNISKKSVVLKKATRSSETSRTTYQTR
jgi:hypothetical protein